MNNRLTDVEIAKLIIESGAVSIKQDGHFVYSSGNRGPGYIMIKGLVGQPAILKTLCEQLAYKIDEQLGTQIDVVNGNVTGGVIPGWEICSSLSKIQAREIPYLYLRVARKEGGHNELITGSEHLKHDVTKRVLIVEELVNYGETTCNAATVFRKEGGYTANHAACILSYDHDQLIERLKSSNIQLISLITLPKLLSLAKKHKLLPETAVNSYLEFLEDPVLWQINRNLVLPLNYNQMARLTQLNYNITSLTSIEAVNQGAPRSQVNNGVQYYKCIDKEAEIKQEHLVYVALDMNTGWDVRGAAQGLSYDVKERYGFKINLDCVLFNNMMEDDIRAVVNCGKPVFIDVKMSNGLRTMENIVKTCVRLGISIVNVYPTIGANYLKKLVNITKGTQTKLFVLTVLTHYDDEYCQQIYNSSMKDLVIKFTKIAYDCKAHGVIVPPTMLEYIKDTPILKMCPGIRPSWFEQDANDQSQILEPKQAVELGANYLVVGSPIFASGSPAENLKRIIAEVNS